MKKLARDEGMCGLLFAASIAAKREAMIHAAASRRGNGLQAMKHLENFASVCHRDEASPERATERFKEFPGIDKRIFEDRISFRASI